MTRLHLALPLVLFCAVGCGSGDDDDDASGAGAGHDGGAGASADAGRDGGGDVALAYRPCSDAQRVGGFSVLAVDMGAPAIAPSTQVFGGVNDGVVPADVWDELAARGECRLLVGPELFCAPACGSSQNCSLDGCIDAPRRHSVGTVTIDGLLQPVSMTPSSAQGYFARAALPYPPFELGAPVDLRAEGGDYAAFALRGAGVALLEPADDAVSVAAGQPVALRWSADAGAGAARVFVELDIAHHGGIAARIECDAEDDGELEIPAELVTGLLERGTAGFPTVTLTRRTVDSTAIEPGCIELEVGAQVVRAVAVEGVTSCSTEMPCPDGGTCQADLTCS